MKCKCKCTQQSIAFCNKGSLKYDHKHAVLGSRQNTKIPPYRRHSCHVFPFQRGSTLLEFRVPRKPAPAKKCHLLSLRLTCAYRNDLQHMKESTRLHARAAKTPSSPIFCLLGTTYMRNMVAMARYCSLKSQPQYKRFSKN